MKGVYACAIVCMCKSEDMFGKLILSYWVGPAIPTQVARLGGKCFPFIHFIHLVGPFSSKKKKLVGIKILEVESVVKESILFSLLELGYLPSTKQEFTFLPTKCLLVRPSFCLYFRHCSVSSLDGEQNLMVASLSF